MIERIRKWAGYSVNGYDALDDRARRRSVGRRTRNEDDILTAPKREALTASARDLNRNFVIAAWAIRKHLDFVSSFTFQAKTPDKGWNNELEAYVAELSKRQNFDVRQRHPLRRAVRLAEAGRVKDGDHMWVKLSSQSRRGKVQQIEGDLIATPGNFRNSDDLVNGVRLDGNGAAKSYSVTRRTRGGQRELVREVPARNAIFHAFWDRSEQVRGVSPIAAAMNWFRDTYESTEYAIAKLKLGQLFGVQMVRDANAPAFNMQGQDKDGDGQDDDWMAELPPGVMGFDLDPGEQASVIESKTPSSETVDFLKWMVHVALKCLGIPYSFFDESFTNFYGSRGGLIQYLKSCKVHIEDLQEFQGSWTDWRVGMGVFDGDLVLPSGVEFRDAVNYLWVPDGTPWWDPAKEVRGHVEAIEHGLDNPQRVCHATGTDFFDNIDRIAAAQAYAEERGVKLSYGDAMAPLDTTTTDQQENQDE